MATSPALRDRRDYPVSTSSRTALDRFERAAELLHGFYLDPVAEIDAALAEDPDFVLAHCFKAGLFCTATEKGAEPVIAQHVAAAEKSAARATMRERGHIAACRAWLDGDFERATALWGAVARDFPRDLVALQFAHLGDFYLGRSQMLRDRIAGALPAWSEAVPGMGFVLGMHAFGLEEMQQYGEAERAGERALALNPRDPWAVHAVTHVYEMQGRHEDGIGFLNRRSGDWAPGNSFAYHNWWHLALLHLDRGEYARVLDLYDNAIRPKPSAVALEMLDASALLWRLRLRGADVGARWKELADGWAPMAEDGYYAFNDVHALMAFLGAGRGAEASRLVTVLERRAREGGTNGPMTREVGLPLARGLVAFDAGDFAGCAAHLLPVREIAQRFGGSHAQRDVIGLTLIESALRGRQTGLARALAAERIALKPSSPFNRELDRRARALAA